MHFSLVLVLISLVHVPGCDLTGGPVDMQKKTEAQLRQYFPRGHVIVSPEQRTISAVTCTEGLGKPVIEEMGKYLAKMPGIERLQRARQLPVKMSPYRLFVLEFDEYCVRFDTDSNQHWTSLCDPELRLRYERICGVRTTLTEQQR